MQVFNRHVSARGLTVFGFETVLISGAILLAAQIHGSFNDAISGIWRVMLVTAPRMLPLVSCSFASLSIN